MSLQQQLLDLGELFNFADLSTFTQNIPIEWVASALDLSAQASIRRRLPGDQVLWLVLGMVLFRYEPVHEVARRLNICAQGLASHDLLARSGIRRRANDWADPVEWLFRQTGSQWGRERYDGDTWQGLHVLAIDGALLRIPHTPELREHFGSGNTPNDRQTPYPMLRLVALMNVRSHLILDAQLSPRQSRRPAVSGALGNRAGLPGYQEFSATECDDPAEQGQGVDLPGGLGAIAGLQHHPP